MAQVVKRIMDFELLEAQPWHDSTDFGELSRAELAEVRQGERSTETSA